jgi:hypothetical protein
VLHILSLLPADERARAACVCRGWRVTLLELSLWTRLDLSPSSGVHVRVTDAVLAGAAAKTRGQLAALDVSDCEHVSFDALLAAVQANGGALRELRAGASVTLDADRVTSLLLAAPQLAACHADVDDSSSVVDVRRMLRNEAPFQPLRVRTLRVVFPTDADDEASALELAADLAAHASLRRLTLRNAPVQSAVALDAVVDAALALQLQHLSLSSGGLSPASAPALVRLLGVGTLTSLLISQEGEQLLDGPSAALLGAALRDNTTLKELRLLNTGFWHDTDAASVLLSALTGHPSLQWLSLFGNDLAAAHVAAAGAALSTLIAANAPALTVLDVSLCDLGDAGLRPLCDALPANTHLRKLDLQPHERSICARRAAACSACQHEPAQAACAKFRR